MARRWWFLLAGVLTLDPGLLTEAAGCLALMRDGAALRVRGCVTIDSQWCLPEWRRSARFGAAATLLCARVDLRLAGLRAVCQRSIRRPTTPAAVGHVGGTRTFLIMMI